MIITLLIMFFLLSAVGGDCALWRSLPGSLISTAAAHWPPLALMFYGQPLRGGVRRQGGHGRVGSGGYVGPSKLCTVWAAHPPRPTVVTLLSPFKSSQALASKGISLVSCYLIVAFAFIYELDWTSRVGETSLLVLKNWITECICDVFFMVLLGSTLMC
jgi:hypothetical protein